MSYTVSVLEEAHAAEILRLRGDVLTNLSDDNVRAFLNDSGQIWLGLHREGDPSELAGFMRAEDFPDPTPGVDHPGWYVRWFYIDPERRGEGYSQLFWPKLCAELDAASVTELYAVSRRMKAWRRYGFQPVALAGGFEHPDAKPGNRWTLIRATSPWKL